MDSLRVLFNKYDKFIERYDLFIWDFDLTILKIHSYAMDIKASDVKSLSWNKFKCHFSDPLFFRDLINYIIGKNKEVAIISFGTYNVIKAYMDRLFDNNKIFDLHNIITPIDRNIKLNSDKNQYIIDLIRNISENRIKNISYKRVLFFDDSLRNVQSAREMGVNAIIIKENEGFNKKVWDNLALSKKYNIEQNVEKFTQKDKPRISKKSKKKKKILIEGFTNTNKDNNIGNNRGNLKNVYNLIPEVYMNWINILATIVVVFYFSIKYFNRN